MGMVRIDTSIVMVVATFCASSCLAGQPLVNVGVAKIDITPDYPIRLSGYGSRRTEAEGVEQTIWAKALAIGSDADGPVVLLAVDNCGVPGSMTDEVAARLEKKTKVRREGVAVCSSHTHTAPMLAGVLELLFGMPIPAEHQAKIDRYTRELTDRLETVALAALADRRPSHIDWAVGKVTFANNRRSKGGPVDHSLPMLRVRDADGNVRAILVTYACHCTTLGGEFNRICGDWAGYAQEYIERDHPGAIALVAIGCGADANPQPRRELVYTRQHGEEIAREVNRLLKGKLKSVGGKVTTRLERIELPFDKLPTREDWTNRRESKHRATAYHAKVQLRRLEGGKPLATKLSYPVQTWCFGDSLAMVFLAGEVVVDYSLRLKRELDGARLWVNAYSNDVPCYIASKRVLKEGGYEAVSSMIYYDRPTRFAPELEDRIVETVKKLVPKQFHAKPGLSGADKRSGANQEEFPPPKSPEASLSSILLRPGLRVELVAAEPLVVDPVAIDFGPDGTLWVAEMHDYPAGLQGDYKPGGRVRLLRDTDGDGKYDHATLFLTDIPFPIGIMAWRDGVLVCAAPDILYAEDTNGDDKADHRRVLFSGFDTTNYQARVNSLSYGLDNWIYGANGLLGGTIRSPLDQKLKVNLGTRDFRMKPAGAVRFDLVSGRTQHGRVRDDWGNWFGNTNSVLLSHYPMPDRYVRRNPHIPAPSPRVFVPEGGAKAHQLYPISRTLKRFNSPQSANRVTSACSPVIYRDELLGPDYYGNAFICEPVHNVVCRRILKDQGVTFTGRRAPGEEQSEFLASRDNWFRPVQLKTGPDGALWVVDMYRFVIEHPRWITSDRLAQLDVRAGDDKGRIYRVLPRDKPPRKVTRLDRLDTAGLVKALDHPNGWQRDMAQQLLVRQQDKKAISLLERLAAGSKRVVTRMQALCTLDGLNALRPDVLTAAFGDPHPGVRRHAVRLCEPLLATSPELGAEIVKLVGDPDAQVRFQLACTLGEWKNPYAGRALGQLALANASNAYITAAVMSSITKDNLGPVAAVILDAGRERNVSTGLYEKLLVMAAAFGKDDVVVRVLDQVAAAKSGTYAARQISAVAAMLDSLNRHKVSLKKLAERSGSPGQQTRERLNRLFEFARKTAVDPKAAIAVRLPSLRLLGRDPDRRGDDIRLMSSLLVPQSPLVVQTAAVASLGKLPDKRVPDILLAGWRGFGPAVRASVLDIVLGRDEWIPMLLDRVEQKQISPGEFDARRRQQLAEHKNKAISRRASKLLATSINADRSKVVKDYQSAATLEGNRERGEKIFEKRCSVCHRLNGTGYAIGPDLVALTDKSPQALLVATLDPNRAVLREFITYTALTVSGMTHVGILVAETGNSITLKQQEAKEAVILRGDLEELVSSGKSLMPEGLEKDLSPRDLADVMAYIAATGPELRKFPGNEPSVVKASGNGELRLLATTCQIYGKSLIFEPRYQNLGYWHSLEDRAVWTVDVPTAGTYVVAIRYACQNDSAGNTLLLEAAGERLTSKVGGTGDTWDTYFYVGVGRIRLEAGRQTITLRAAHPIRGALADVCEVKLVPITAVEKGTR